MVEEDVSDEEGDADEQGGAYGDDTCRTFKNKSRAQFLNMPKNLKKYIHIFLNMLKKIYLKQSGMYLSA